MRLRKHRPSGLILYKAFALMSLSLLTLALTPDADAQAPAAPTAVAATAVTGKVTLTWAAPAGTPTPTSYSVFRAIAAGGEGATPYATGVTGTSYTDNGVTDGTTYFYKVRAVAAGVTGNSAGEASVTPLDPPQSVSATLVVQPGDAEVSLSWPPSAGAAGYNVYRSVGVPPSASSGSGQEGAPKAGVAAGTPLKRDVTANTLLDQGLTNGDTYYYQVTAMAGSSSESYGSAESSATASASLPAAPYNLIAKASGASVSLSWEAVGKSATGYNLYRSTASGGEGSTPYQSGLTGVAWTDTAVLGGTRYYYEVTAVSSGGESCASKEATVVTLSPPTVQTPASASPSPVTGTTAALSVTGADAGGEAGLTYTWAATGTPPAPVSFSVNGTNAAKNSTATFGASGTYSLQVTIQDGNGLTATSAVAVVVQQTPLTVSVTPSSATVTAGGTQPFAAAVSDQFSAAITSPSVTWAVPAAAGTIDSTGLFTASSSAGGPYTITATAGAASGTAGVTVTANAAPPAAPTNLTVNAAYGQNTLSWTASVGATSYNIYRGTSPGGEGATPLATGVTSAPFVDTGLTNGTTYYYTVQAVGGGGSGGGGGGGGSGGGSSGSSGPSGEGGATPNPSASPGYFLTTFWGGTYTNSFVTGPQSDSGSGDGWGVGDPTGITDCSGPIRVTLTYQPGSAADTPPQSVVVAQTCSTFYRVWSATKPVGSAADGLGDPEVDISYSYNGVPWYFQGTSTGTYYSVVQPGANGSVTVTLSGAHADLNYSSLVGNDTGQASLSYSINKSPGPTIQLSGSKPDPDGKSQDILVGQGCTASVVNLPTYPAGTTLSYLWKVTGTTFQSWSPTTPASAPGGANTQASYEQDGPGPLTNPTAHWFWNDASNTTESVDCTVTVTPPTGQAAVPPIVLSTKKVNVMRPVASWGVDPKTLPISVDGQTTNAPTSTGFQDNSSTSGSFGATTVWYPVTISVPSPFVGGNGCFVE